MASRHDRKGSLRDKESAPLFRKAITKNAFLEECKGGGKKVGGGKHSGGENIQNLPVDPDGIIMIVS